MAKKAMYIKEVGVLAQELGLSRPYVSQIIHGHRVRKSAAIRIWIHSGIKSKGQGIDYKSIPRGE
jgi:transcriptional regulator with XRE-family HTH domain